MTEADDAVKKIRSVKEQLDERAPKMTNVKDFAMLSKSLTDSLGSVEDSVYQTRNKSGEDPLNFPVRLNNQIAALLGFVQSGRPPSAAAGVSGVRDRVAKAGYAARTLREIGEAVSRQDQRDAEGRGIAADGADDRGRAAKTQRRDVIHR